LRGSPWAIWTKWAAMTCGIPAAPQPHIDPEFADRDDSKRRGIPAAPQPQIDHEFADRDDSKRPASRLSRAFDSTGCSVAFGIVAPIVCFALKPVLLAGDGFELPGNGGR